MRWLREHGLISNVADYDALPFPVLEDARLLMDAEAVARKRQAQQEEQARRRNGGSISRPGGGARGRAYGKRR